MAHYRLASPYRAPWWAEPAWRPGIPFPASLEPTHEPVKRNVPHRRPTERERPDRPKDEIQRRTSDGRPLRQGTVWIRSTF